MIVEGVGVVTHRRYRLDKCMLPRRISAGNKNEAKKTTKRGASSSANFFRNLGGMPSGPEALSCIPDENAYCPLTLTWHVLELDYAFGNTLKKFCKQTQVLTQ